MNWTRLLERWADKLASIGQLRHRLLLEAPSATPDGAGGTTSVFVPVVTVWAGLHPLWKPHRRPAKQEKRSPIRLSSAIGRA